MGTSRNFTSGCSSLHTAVMSSPTISGPHELITNRAEMGRSFASRMVRARMSSPPCTISSTQSFVHIVIVSM